MEEKVELKITSDDLDKIAKKNEKMSLKTRKQKKLWLVFLISGIVGFVGGVVCLLVVLLKPVEERVALVFPEIPSKTATESTYSDLTGEILASADLKNAPVYCIQVPNGLDGARPQVGLTEAGVIFEAIAEAGITRFAAIFQNPSTAVIGPIRSLRIYYLNWDTPFDCTIVHAGGSADALAAVGSGAYKDLTENYAYMYRGTAYGRLWNNLFTTSQDLRQVSADRGYNSSNVQGFARLTPAEAEKARIDGMVEEKLKITTATEKDTSKLNPETSTISFRFGSVGSFNVVYNYDLATNTYHRSYGDGNAHEIYKCPDEDRGEVDPENICSLTQMTPKVVVAMIVEERRASDNYHEDVTVIGSGEAYVFQNGVVKHGTWNKGSAGEQIKFLDDNGNEIRLVPGQTFISAIPYYGGVDY
ncbi:DUF3048 domain-containing protein [Candidatus Saccharibacteria bacterium]|nr:DUF3048 domain-containing protein [Candidatus Saccharibacteria bacterium]